MADDEELLDDDEEEGELNWVAIIIAAVLALALIGGLIWYFVLREEPVEGEKEPDYISPESLVEEEIYLDMPELFINPIDSRGRFFLILKFDIAFNIHDFLFGTALWGMGTFMWLLANPNVGNYGWVRAISNRMLGIYVSHLLIIILLFNVCGVLGITELAKDVTVFFGTVLLSFGLVVAIEKSPLRHMLLR